MRVGIIPSRFCSNSALAFPLGSKIRFSPRILPSYKVLNSPSLVDHYISFLFPADARLNSLLLLVICQIFDPATMKFSPAVLAFGFSASLASAESAKYKRDEGDRAQAVKDAFTFAVSDSFLDYCSSTDKNKVERFLQHLQEWKHFPR